MDKENYQVSVILLMCRKWVLTARR